jgi:hypothetical protein
MAKLTREDIEASVASKYFHRVPNTTVTICVLTLKNGFNTVGTSACVDPAEFNAEIGTQVAFEDALNKIWNLEGYLMKQRMYDENAPQTQPVNVLGETAEETKGTERKIAASSNEQNPKEIESKEEDGDSEDEALAPGPVSDDEKAELEQALNAGPHDDKQPKEEK